MSDVSNDGDGPVTREILQKAVATELVLAPGDVEICSFETEAGSKPGDNFCCDIKAVTVRARVKPDVKEEKVFHYMAKCMPTSEKAKLMRELGAWRSEIEAFFKHLPRMSEILQSSGKTISTPKAYYGSEDEDVIIMENLKTKGYTMIDKIKGLDLDQIKLVLDQLSLFHSASYKYIQNHPDGIEQLMKDSSPLLKRNYWLPMPSEGGTFLQEQGDDFYKRLAMTALPGRVEADLLDKVEQWFDKIDSVMPAILADSSNWRFACFNHSDVWTNNFLFSILPDGRTEKLQLIDLQTLNYNRPTLDLAYFFASSLSPKQRRESPGLTELLKYYHGQLQENLQMLGYEDVYSYEQLEEDFRQSIPFLLKTAVLHAVNTHAGAEHWAIFQAAESCLSKKDEEKEAALERMEEVKEEEAKKALKNEALVDTLVQAALETEEWNGFV